MSERFPMFLLHTDHTPGSLWMILIDALSDCLIDGLKMLPILFLAYLLMEFMEHHAGEKMDQSIRKVGKAGPLMGALLGAIPQCGFSGAIAGLYAGGVTTIGTLIAVFLSTSDEMIPLLLASGTAPLMILKLIGSKILMGILFGYIVDLLIRAPLHAHIDELCEQDHGDMEEPGIWISAIRHTIKTMLIILLISFLLDLLFALGGEDFLSHLLPDIPVVQELLTGLIGLIPSCSASVFLTELYSQGILSVGALLSGLATNAGVGLLVLFRQNRRLKKNLLIVGILYVCGVLGGLVFGMIL